MRSAHPQIHTHTHNCFPPRTCVVVCIVRARTLHTLFRHIYTHTYIAFLPFTAGAESYYSSSSSSSISCGNMSSVCDDREGHGSLEAARDTPFLIRSRCKPERGIARLRATARKSSSLSLSFGSPLFIFYFLFFFTLECALSRSRESDHSRNTDRFLYTRVSVSQLEGMRNQSQLISSEESIKGMLQIRYRSLDK